MKTVGVKAIVTMQRVLYIDVAENLTKEDIIQQAQREIILPHNALIQVNQTLNKLGIRLGGLDLADWEVADSIYNLIDNDEN